MTTESLPQGDEIRQLIAELRRGARGLAGHLATCELEQQTGMCLVCQVVRQLPAAADALEALMPHQQAVEREIDTAAQVDLSVDVNNPQEG